MRTNQGYISGGRTFRIGDSSFTVGGQIARTDIARLKRFLADAERYYQTAGYDMADGYGYPDEVEGYPYDTGDFLSDFTKGAGMVRDVANNPMVAGLATAAGPYGQAALAAANGVPAALDMMKSAGILPEHAQQVAQLHHPDPAMRAEAERRTKALKKAAEAGDKKAKALVQGLRIALVQHLQAQLAECQASLRQAQERLASYGDPMAYAAPPSVLHAERLPMPPVIGGLGGRIAGATAPAPAWGTTSGPVVGLPPSLIQALQTALARARTAPEPSFRRMPLRRRA